MASLVEVEALYYRAIEAAKLMDINATDDRAILYSKMAFQNWVKKLDIFDMGKEKADFYLDKEIVTTFTDYRNKVVAELPGYTEYDGIKLSG